MRCLATVIGASLFCLTVSACSQNEPVKPSASAEDVRRETAEALRAARAYTSHQREEYQQKVEMKLNELVQGIATLQGKAERAGARGKAELNGMIAELQQKTETAQRHVEELKAAGTEAWEDLKVATEAAMKDLERGYERARARFGT